MFTTDRLILRPFKDSDADHITRMRNIPEVTRNVSKGPLVPLSSSYAEVTKNFVKGALIYVVITMKDTGEFMGTSKLSTNVQKNRDANFGVCLLPEYWSKGYGTEVSTFMIDHGFRWLGLHRVMLEVGEGNQRAMAVYKKM